MPLKFIIKWLRIFISHMQPIREHRILNKQKGISIYLYKLRAVNGTFCLFNHELY
ncbi:conserved hypothetical protein [Xenorhabdus nematophila F1]|uniref:Uncharacterized protein n=1 Tax=Xenorhabdus nematophila (strain ATCC 19061 / DSM 3370 / CCUG 14189 / LMG 1036 / NCIMB 9965 / AN6) TaxID=406817 RepID=D3VB58_XENNA|nr:hypothetical protein XNC1_3802 [Xenorhabdus nematophila ATCC 19061]CCW32899.1 conserved hypothetical protein [Xenorhabdus nematophila F1]CEE90585.1 hypothetical protein XNA1_1610003 [Xenorhabdus nematophila str. Anatoliense]CEF28762.1 hypothetical protein XNW1_1360021 [Xenorhabdus nematophila str. Websteri]CEK24651.1 hypothetical protein XNC2_3657 [Xenorhabdus nematophila AN6/1]